MNRRKWFKTLFGAAAATVIPLPEIKAAVPQVVDPRLSKMLIPMFRRTFPEIVVSEIVSVQPMTDPVGLTFVMKYKHSKR